MASVEILRVIHFDPSKTVLAINDYEGDVARIVLPLRTIIRDAVTLGSVGLLLSHNHPSGDPTPSLADITATQMLARAARLLGIKVHDHVIRAAGRSVSFRSQGLL
jgi:DNA repair protein RadC